MKYLDKSNPLRKKTGTFLRDLSIKVVETEKIR